MGANTFNARATQRVYDMSRSDAIDKLVKYLLHGREGANKILSAAYDALETLPEKTISADAKVVLDLEDEYLPDAAILYTLSLRKRTLFHGNGACFQFSDTQITAMINLLGNSDALPSLTQDEKSATQALLEQTQKSKQAISKDHLTTIGAEDGLEKATYTCTREIMGCLYHTWQKLIGHLHHNTDIGQALNLSLEQKEHVLSQGVFGGRLEDPARTDEWAVIVEGLIDYEAMKRMGAAAQHFSGEKQA
jgi:hypothetical protein